MTLLVLTPEQEAALLKTYELKHQKAVADCEARAARAYAALQRRADDRVNRANQRTTDWKQRFLDTRKKLIEANTEVIALKRRLRNGEWNDETDSTI